MIIFIRSIHFRLFIPPLLCRIFRWLSLCHKFSPLNRPAQEASELIQYYGNNCSPQQQEYEAPAETRASVASKERRKVQHTAKLFLNGIIESFFNLLILFTKRPVNVSRVAAIIRLG